MTKSELMYFAAGVAVGGAVGANWSKIKPLLDQFMAPATEGFGDAYGDIARAFAERFESVQDAAAERRQESRTTNNTARKKKTRKKHAA